MSFNRNLYLVCKKKFFFFVEPVRIFSSYNTAIRFCEDNPGHILYRQKAIESPLELYKDVRTKTK